MRGLLDSPHKGSRFVIPLPQSKLSSVCVQSKMPILAASLFRERFK